MKSILKTVKNIITTPFYKNNPNLRAEHVEMEYTAEQIEELILCSQDPIYFIENYVKIINVDKGLISFEPYEYQKKIVNTVNDNRFNVIKLPRQSGKCDIYTTLIKIRNKKTGEIEEISVGDFHNMLKNDTINNK